MNIIPPDRSEYLCPSTRDQFDRYLSIANTIVQASPRSLHCQDPGDLQFKRRPRKLRKTEQRPPPSTIPESDRLHATDDANKMRRRRILHTACATLTIQPTSVDDAAFLEELVRMPTSVWTMPSGFRDTRPRRSSGLSMATEIATTKRFATSGIF